MRILLTHAVNFPRRACMATTLSLWTLSVSLVLLAGLLSRLSRQYGPPHTNYDGSVYFSHAHLITPSSKDDIISVARTAAGRGQKVRVVGSGHSWSAVASSDDILVSLWNYTGIVSLDRDAMEVTVKAGTTLKQLNQYLDEQGLAMKNLGSISAQTVAGAISTGTHGNGVEFGNLATLVTGLELVNGKGELVSTSANKNPELFKAALVSIGMLGIITEVTFTIEKSYLLREVLTPHTLEECLLNFNPLMSSGQHAKMWIELFSGKCGVYIANRTIETSPRDNPSWIMKNIEVTAMEAILYICSWFPVSIPHVVKLMFQSPSSVFFPHDRVDTSYHILEVPHVLPIHWEAELVLPMEGCSEAITELRRLVVEDSIPVNMPIEVRPVKADDIWLSPDYRRASCHITLTVYNPTPDTARTYFRRFFESTEKNLSLAPRIHWGKYVIGVGRSEVESMYPRLTDFARIRQQMDPHGIFINQPLRELFAFEK